MADGTNEAMLIEVADSPLTASGEAMPWLPGGPLPAALVTGHKAIDFEHRQLLACMTAARSICVDIRNFTNCGNCIEARRSLCDNELVRLLGDLLAFILEHFKTEEEIMRDSLLMMVDRDVCEAHMEDHAAISTKIQQIVASLDSMHTVGLLRDLDNLLGRWISNHITMHDLVLARWVSREDSVVSLARLPGV